MSANLRILIIRLSALGDVINTLPVIQELKQAYPESSISWLVEPAAAPIVEAQPGVDETILVDRKRWQRELRNPLHWPGLLSSYRELAKRIGTRRFDIALDFQGNLRCGALQWLSHAERRVGYHPEDRQEPDLGFTSEQVPPLASPCHRVEKALHLLRALGIDPGPPCAELPIPEAASRRVEQFLCDAGLNGRPLVAVHPGTSRFGGYKQWTDDGYRELCQRLAEELNASVVVTWSGPERDHVAGLVEGLPDSVMACFETDLLELAALYGKSDLFVGGDTGPGHLASLTGAPVVSIFGPKDPDMYRPYFSPCTIVERDLWCRPCVSRTCSAPVCLSELPATEVFNAVCRALGGDRPTDAVHIVPHR